MRRGIVEAVLVASMAMGCGGRVDPNDGGSPSMAQGAAGSAGGATNGAATATHGPARPPTGPASPPTGPTSPPTGPTSPPTGPTSPPTGPTSPPTGPTSPPPNSAPPPTSALPAAPTADLSANANWYTFSDRTIPHSAPPVLLSPPPPGSVVPPEGQPPALVPFRAGLQAREVTGGGEVLWGVGFGFDFADSVSLANMVLAQGGQAPFNECDAGLTYDLKTQPVPVSVDASAHAGISFWG